jgi:hypothetical protein
MRTETRTDVGCCTTDEIEKTGTDVEIGTGATVARGAETEVEIAAKIETVTETGTTGIATAGIGTMTGTGTARTGGRAGTGTRAARETATRSLARRTRSQQRPTTRNQQLL